jgi:DNA-binding transcriptional ArsR family regulator
VSLREVVRENFGPAVDYRLDNCAIIQLRNLLIAHIITCSQWGRPDTLSHLWSGERGDLAALRAKKAVPQVSDMMKALSDPRRVAILRLVREAEMPAGEIASHFRTSRQAVSQNLKILARAGLIGLRQQGTRRFYRIRPEAFESIRSFLEAFWDDRLSLLKETIELRRRTRHE